MFSKILLLLLMVAIAYDSISQGTKIFKPDSIKREIDAVQITTALPIDGLMNKPEPPHNLHKYFVFILTCITLLMI